MILRAAVVQFKPALANVEENITRHRYFIREALEGGANLIVFPELSLTGYLLGWLVPQVSLKLEDGVWEDLTEGLGDRVLIVGAVIEERDMFYNAMVVLSGEGILGVHRKVYLPTYGMFDEGRYFTAGPGFEKIKTPLGDVAVMICEDAWHMDAYLSRADADFFVLSANNPLRVVQGGTAVEVWHRIASLPSLYFGAPTLYANRVGVEDGIVFFGGSRIYQGNGVLSAEAPLFEETVIFGDIDTDLRRAARYNSATLREHLNHALRKGA